MRILHMRRAPAPEPVAEPTDEPVSCEHDERALAAANRRIVQLETDNTRLQHHLDRARCNEGGCDHAKQLTGARADLRIALEANAEMRQATRGFLDRLRALNAPEGP